MKIRETFENRKKNGQKALVTYIVSGDYGYETTKENIRAMVKAGADVIEIGIPFSDPIAEGVVIQEASQHSLAGGTTLKGIFQMVKELREEIKETPFVMMMYLNTIYRFGTERFFDLCNECGIQGVIVPDMPYEEKDEIQGVATAHEVDNISLVTPTSHDRIAMIAKEAEGFGISEPKQAKKMAAQSDGVIVGSAIVKLCEKYGADCVPHISTFVKEMKDAIR